MPASQTISDVQRRALRDHWVLYLVEGIALVIVGASAVALPPLATLAVTLFIGWVIFLKGVVGLLTTFFARRAPGFWWSLLSAALAVMVGGLLLVSPLGGALTLTALLIGFFLVGGAASIMFAFDHRRELSGRWGWMLASGVLDLVLAALIFAGLPSASTWVIGLLVGISIIFGGVALMAMALNARGAG
ncbi:MAG: HdeD family acid-resistance protein [Pseudolabrys sp.]